MMELECACLCRRVHGPASPPTSFALNLVKLSSWMTEAVHCAFEDCSTLSICINHVLTQPLPVPSSFRRYWKAHSLPILHVLRHTHVARLVGDHCHQQVYLEHSLLFSLLSCTRDRILLKLVFLCFFFQNFVSCDVSRNLAVSQGVLLLWSRQSRQSWAKWIGPIGQQMHMKKT